MRWNNNTGTNPSAMVKQSRVLLTVIVNRRTMPIRTATGLPPNIVENMKQTRRVKTILPSTSLFSVTLTFCYDLAYECINAVRERAGIKKLAANLDEESFRKAIKDERAMELCFEYTRRFDLIRWGDYYKLMQEQVDKAQADESWKFGINVYTYFNIPKSYNYFPIPANEIGSNGAIKTNNPGW